MNEKTLYTYRLYFTGIVTTAIWLLLLWTHYNGGVQSHHLLHREELPAISNWWSGLLIPALCWGLLYRVQKRLMQVPQWSAEAPVLLKKSLYGFTAALCYGALIALAFTLKIDSVPGYLILGVLFIALFYPVYRAECVLGFILGMTVTFGAFIPTIVAAIFAIPAYLISRIIAPFIKNLFIKYPSQEIPLKK